MAVQIEERLFAEDDPDFLRRVQDVKAALLQWEVAGRLSALQSQALADQCQRSPQLAAELAEVRARSRTPGRIALVPPGRPAEKSTPPARSRWKVALGFAAAAVLALVAGNLLRSHQPAQPSSAATSPPVAAPSTPGTSNQPAAVATVLFLPAGVLRGAEAAKPLPLPDPTRPVDLQIELRTPAGQPRTWSASLYRDQQPLIAAQPVIVKSEGSVHYLDLAISPGTLTPGNYHFILVSASAPAPINRTFTVARK